MGIRDVFIFLVVFGGLPFILRMPAIGIVYWAWLGLMNPHRQAWGLAYGFPFAQVIGLATLAGLLFSKEPKQFKGGAAAWTLLAFMIWTLVTTQFALSPADAWPMLERVVKIQLFTFVALLVMYKREHVTWLAATIVVSIGYYSVKGGLFTIATAGAYRVWGPAGSFIYDNNALALAVVMSIPLWFYFFVISTKKWQRYAIGIGSLLSVVSAIGSQSRGAMLATVAMSALVWFRGKRKLAVGVFFVVIGTCIVAFMPSSWEERMGTITNPEEEGSAKSRLDAWSMLFNLAVDRPLVGGGFDPYTPEVYDRYSFDRGYDKTQTAHSVWFQVLGEQGFVGLFIYLLFWALTWRMCSQISARTRGDPDKAWAFWMAQMVQASLIGFFVGGAFLSLAYWDMPYYLMVLAAVTRHVLASEPRSAGIAGAGRPATFAGPSVPHLNAKAPAPIDDEGQARTARRWHD